MTIFIFLFNTLGEGLSGRKRAQKKIIFKTRKKIKKNNILETLILNPQLYSNIKSTSLYIMYVKMINPYFLI